MQPQSFLSVLSSRWAPVLIFAAAYALSVLYAQAPRMGDDIDYYGFAIARHFSTPAIPPDEGFHFLRWPVWGGIWLYQALFGPGLGSFLFVPRFCVAMGCALLFFLGRRLAGPVAGLLAAVLLFFHPLADGLLDRPMPDVVEGLLGTLGFTLFWVRLKRAEDGVRPTWQATVLSGLALGLLIFITWANRPTGLIWVIGVMMMSLLRPRLMWPVFALALPVAAGCFCVEGLIYQRLFGDFWHSIHANLSATGRQGTGAVMIWELPFRFIDTLIDSTLSKVIVLLALAGAWHLWRRRQQMSDGCVIGWFVLSYFGIACAVQSVFPLRPMVRDGARFLGSVAFPMSLLAGIGLYFLAKEAAQRWPVARRWVVGWRGAAILAAVILAGSQREYWNLDYLPAVSRWMEEAPAGSRVLSHEDFYSLAMMAAPARAQELNWALFSRVKLPTTPKVLSPEDHGKPGWLFLNRSRVLVSARKRFESERAVELADLDGNMRALDEEWRLRDIALKREKPEFYRFALPEEAVQPVSLLPVIRDWEWKPEEQGFFERWRKRARPKEKITPSDSGGIAFARQGRDTAILVHRQRTIPASLRGKTYNLRFRVATKTQKPFSVLIKFFDDRNRRVASTVLEPYGTVRGFYDFQGIHVPPQATHCDLELMIEPNCKSFTLERLDVYVPASRG